MAEVKERIKKMSHYKPPLEGRDSKDYLLLDFNERTTEPSPKVKEALKRFIDSGRLQVYPEYGDLEVKIAQYAGVKPGQTMITNGGDQGIDIICRAHLDEGDKIIIPFPAFAMHYQSAGIQGAEILEPKYKEDGSFPLEETLNLISDEVKLVILCNPNNPLGSAIPIEKVEKVLEKAKEKETAVLHDEAYFEFTRFGRGNLRQNRTFAGITCKDLIEEYDNLYIMRTFAKAFGLVSARAGYLISQEENIQELLKIRGPYDVNMFAKVAILAALEDTEYMKDYVKEIMEESKPKLEKFLREKGIFFYPSAANFLLLKVPAPKKMIEYFKSQGILLRPKPAPDGKEAVRISIGTLKDTERFINTYSRLLNV